MCNTQCHPFTTVLTEVFIFNSILIDVSNNKWMDFCILELGVTFFLKLLTSLFFPEVLNEKCPARAMPGPWMGIVCVLAWSFFWNDTKHKQLWCIGFTLIYPFVMALTCVLMQFMVMQRGLSCNTISAQVSVEVCSLWNSSIKGFY